MNVQKNFINKIIYAILITILSVFTSCSSSTSNVLIVWTDNTEIVSYAEVFNAHNTKTKINIIYKDQIAQSLPPARDEVAPDIVIGSWLKNTNMNKNFLPLDTIFNSNQINPQQIYPSLLAYGKKNNQQYLLPLSFNLPMIIYSVKNSSKIDDTIYITPEILKETAALYNVTNDTGFYTNMGFGPSWKTEFIYEIAKLKDSNFAESGTSFKWDQKNLQNTLDYIKNWTSTKNGSTKAEQDFQFKYLYTPDYKQIDFGPSLFAYTETSSFFMIPSFNFENIKYKWLSGEKTIIAEDNIIMLGVYQKCTNIQEAHNFIAWLINEETQKELLARHRNMNLDKETFGIACGFSSLININEQVFPIYYQNLLGHIPQVDKIHCPYSTFPPRWTSLKERVIIPYLQDATKTYTAEQVKTLEERLDTWKKQFN